MKRINKEKLHKVFIGIRENNELEFNTLCRDYKSLIYGVAFSILKNKEDSEEVVQSVFMKIYELEKDKLPIKNEANWMYSLTKNQTISFLRKKKEYIDMDTLYEIKDENDDMEKTLDRVDFNKLISKLDDKEREIISLKIISNLSFNEIANILDEPASTIKWRYYKAVHTIKVLMANFGMFVITLVIGLKTVFIREKKQELENDKDIEEKEDGEKGENNRGNEEQKKQEGDISNSLKEETEDKDMQENTIDNTIIIDKEEEKIEKDSTNYLGIGAFVLSSIFLMATIIILIFFTKYQLKLRKKTSK